MFVLQNLASLVSSYVESMNIPFNMWFSLCGSFSHILCSIDAESSRDHRLSRVYFRKLEDKWKGRQKSGIDTIT